MQRVIAIDGPAASGKSTTAAAVARRLGWLHLDSGAVYRAATLAALDHLGEDAHSGLRVCDLAARLPVRLVQIGEGFRAEVAGVDVSAAIRSGRVTAAVSAIAALPDVRDWATSEIRRAAAHLRGQGLVVEGRDIGTVVFPEAPLKVYLTASPEARARRRLLESGQPVAVADVAREAARLAARDDSDRQRAVAPLRPDQDAVVVDTTELTFEEQVTRVVALARKLFPR